jgi:predicted ATPase/DNA-binding SARP family transcriptional activator
VAGDDRIRIQVLGPIRVLDVQGRDGTPQGALQRRLLALLVLRRGRVVPADVAVDALWPVDPPGDPQAALQNHVSRLRRRLPADVVSSVADGYRLDPAGVVVDADRLQALSDDAAPDDELDAQLDALLDGWIGPAYPELQDLDDGRAEAIRLGELRVRARELRAQHRLAAGALDGLVAELTFLVDSEPLRERPRSLLMEALTQSGRHVEALRAYDDFRRLLADELGIEPSPALVAQHAELLRGGVVAAPVRYARLPIPATSLVGRENLVRQVLAMRASNRLVTLVGPGGIGKTRVLLEVGRRLAGDGAAPVVLAELAGADPDTAVEQVAACLGIDARPGVEPTGRIAAVIDDTELVLLLDNCEQVVDAVAGLVDELLARCAGVTVVATSRERLRVGGEQVCVVPPLTSADGPDPAVELFVERARAAAPDFDPHGDARHQVEELVARLDRLPLAIELAAARLHTLELEEVVAGLDQRFTLLAGGSRANARHASLEAAVSWSFGLLDDESKDVFVTLSIFAGSFDSAAAAAVCGTDERKATAHLSGLVERSLVMRAPHRRHVLLETLRAFGAERLAASGQDGLVADRHARHLIGWLERAQHELMVPGAQVLADIDRALPELQAALGHLLDRDDIDGAGALVTPLIDYAMLRLRPDVMAWAERVLAADPGSSCPEAPRLWAMAAYASWLTGDMEESERRTDRALDVAEASASGVPPEVLTIRGNQALFVGDLAQAAAWYGRAVEASRGQPGRRTFVAATELLALGYAGDPRVEGRARDLLDEVGEAETPYAAYVWYCAGEAVLASDPDLARGRLTTALELARATHGSFVTGVAGASRVSIDARLGDPRDAAAAYAELIRHWRRAGVWSTQWTMLRAIAVLLERLGRLRDAAVLEGAVRSTAAGHRIFGADRAALDELRARLRSQMGDADYAAAVDEGRALDGDAAVEHALRSL